MPIIEVGTPSEYGFPEKFSSFRATQKLGLSRILEESFGLAPRPRFRGVQMVVGSGKTGYLMALDRIRRLAAAPRPDGRPFRTAIITMTKPLQAQIMADFSALGLHDIRGRANYDCQLYHNCEIGGDNECPFTQRTRPPSDCSYRSAYSEALNSELVVTNLSYWIAVHRFGEGLGPFDLLIIDEAHSLLSGLTEASTVRVPPDKGPAGNFNPDKGPAGNFNRLHHASWVRYAADRIDSLEREIPSASSARVATRLKRELSDMLIVKDDVSPDSYAIDLDDKGWAQLTPIWPADQAERLLYLGIPEVCLLSGTLLRKTMDLVGASPDTGSSRFESYPIEFNPADWPVQLVDAGRIQHNMTAATRSSWLAAIAAVLDQHPNEKGIIHSVSYTRAREIEAWLPARLQRRIRTHTSSTLQETVDMFKASSDPVVLCSPSVTTGFDFPGDECSFVIIPKMPRQDFSSLPNLRRARRQRDPLYEDYEMMMAFGQSIGRGFRSADDRSAVYVLDSHARYLLPKHKGTLVPGWVYSLLVWGDKGNPIPKPPAF